jgi:hypothetical protein
VGSGRNDSRLVSFFGRANYGFKDRYFLTGAVRRDGSSRFGSGNKWAVFPALSGLVADQRRRLHASADRSPSCASRAATD